MNQTGTDNAIVAEQTASTTGPSSRSSAPATRRPSCRTASRNLVAATIFGDDNRVTVNQIGDDNAYGLLMVGTNPEHVVNQIGNGNTATQIVAPGLLPAGIEQRGNGLEVLVERY